MDDKFKNKVLAEELIGKLDDRKNIGFYYTLAGKYDHEFLRSIMHWVSDYPNPHNKGKLFTWELKNRLAKSEMPKDSEMPDIRTFNEQKRKLSFSFNKTRK